MRKLFLVLLAVGLVLFAALLPLVIPWHCPVTKEACERIKGGMTRPEVEAILGVVEGDYRTLPVSPGLVLFEGGWWMGRGRITYGRWVGNEVELHVKFDDGVASLIQCVPQKPFTGGLAELALWRLGRLKDRWFPP
jgi:hypothetical protein